MNSDSSPTLPPFKDKYTDADFDDLCWHDNYIHGIAIHQEEFKADLVLDIDFIIGCVSEGSCDNRYWLAPATLVFHDVTDLKMHIDWASNGPGFAVHYASIGGIRRDTISESPVCCGRPSCHWQIDINWPRDSVIEFRASGFTQTLRNRPILWDQDQLPTSQRPAIS